MERRIITLTDAFPHVTSVDWDIDWREQSSGTSIAGRREIALNSLPRWVGRPSFNFANEAIGLWRAHRLAARGMTGIFRVTMLDTAVFDVPNIATPFSDSATFSDGASFGGEYTVTCPSGAAAGANQITVDMATATGTIRQGQFLSHDDWPFCVTSILGDVLTIEMPLRRAIPAGALIRLQARGLFEMVEARTGNAAYGLNRFAETDMVLQEWLR
jgi:hypothetical protein